MAVYGRSLLNQLCVIETIAPAAQRCDTSEVWLSWLLTDTLDTLLMELERARATWLVAENIAFTPFSSLPRLHRRWTPFNTSFFAMNRRKMKRPLNALIRSKMKKKRWCWNEDGGGLTCCWTELLQKFTHIVMRYEPIQDIQQPRGATEKVWHVTTNFENYLWWLNTWWRKGK